MSETAINTMIIAGFAVIVAGCLACAYFYGKRAARRFGASDEDLDKSFKKARSKIGLIVGIFLAATVVLFMVMLAYLNTLS